MTNPHALSYPIFYGWPSKEVVQELVNGLGLEYSCVPYERDAKGAPLRWGVCKGGGAFVLIDWGLGELA